MAYKWVLLTTYQVGRSSKWEFVSQRQKAGCKFSVLWISKSTILFGFNPKQRILLKHVKNAGITWWFWRMLWALRSTKKKTWNLGSGCLNADWILVVVSCPHQDPTFKLFGNPWGRLFFVGNPKSFPTFISWWFGGVSFKSRAVFFLHIDNRWPLEGSKPSMSLRMSSKSWQEAVEKERYKTSKKKGKSEMWVRGPSQWWDVCFEESGWSKRSQLFCTWKWKAPFFFPGLVSRENLSFISQLPCVLDP